MLTRRNLLLSGAAASGLVLAGAPAFAAKPAVYQADGLAIGGYDPVAYFTEGAPVRGAAQHSLVWNGANWQFANARARDQFAADPEAFAPAYGGYCAYAVSRNYTASTVPQAWHIWENRLFLNYSRSVRVIWRRDIPGNVQKGDANWPKVLTA